jgi:hypothetical protein
MASRTIALVIGTLICLGAAPALSQQKFKYSFKTPPGVAKFTQQHVLDVGDAAGHQIRIGELHTKFADQAPEYDGVKVVEAWGRLMSDYTNGNGRLVPYTVLHMANGDKIYHRGEGVSHSATAADGSRRISYSIVVTITGGTGKFANLRGLLRQTGFSDLKSGTSDAYTDGEYWYEK